MEARHKDEGLVLLAVNLDRPEGRSRIPAFLKKHGIHARVLLGTPESLKGYETDVASTLYVMDRNGLLAGVPGEFVRALEKSLEARLLDLLAGKTARGPVLWALEKSPPGFGILWRQPLDTADVSVAIAPASEGRPAEIGLFGKSHLTRYSGSGELLGEAPLDSDHLYGPRGADLDGDGRNEWAATDGESVTLLDGAGKEFWKYYSLLGPEKQIVGIADLNGDGIREVVIQEPSTVVAKKALGGILWRTPSMGPLRSVVPDPSGFLLMQTEEGIQALDRDGRPRGAPVKAPGGVLEGRVDQGGGRTLEIFGPPYNLDVDAGHDLDGDGKKEVVVSERGGITVYRQDGSPLVILRITDNQHHPSIALENLDGRPGDEMVVAIPDYGLVALGISPQAKPVESVVSKAMQVTPAIP